MPEEPRSVKRTSSWVRSVGAASRWRKASPSIQMLAPNGVSTLGASRFTPGGETTSSPTWTPRRVMPNSAACREDPEAGTGRRWQVAGKRSGFPQAFNGARCRGGSIRADEACSCFGPMYPPSERRNVCRSRTRRYAPIRESRSEPRATPRATGRSSPSAATVAAGPRTSSPRTSRWCSGPRSRSISRLSPVRGAGHATISILRSGFLRRRIALRSWFAGRSSLSDAGYGRRSA